LAFICLNYEIRNSILFEENAHGPATLHVAAPKVEIASMALSLKNGTFILKFDLGLGIEGENHDI
jgi:hypothetical protein